jgi:hypothetical protein
MEVDVFTGGLPIWTCEQFQSVDLECGWIKAKAISMSDKSNTEQRIGQRKRWKNGIELQGSSPDRAMIAQIIELFLTKRACFS